MDRLFLFPAARPRDPAVDRWFDDRPGPLGAIARDTFDLLRRADADMRELIHDGRPTACLTDAAIATVDLHRSHVTLSFFRGAELPDPARLLRGEGRLMRSVRLAPGATPDPAALEALVMAAAAQTRAMLSPDG